MLQLQEMVLSLLCVVALMMLLWDLMLQLRMRKLETKIKRLEEMKALEEKQRQAKAK